MEPFELVTFTDYGVKSGHWVWVSHINDPSNFFIRPVKYRKFIEGIERTCPQDKPDFLNTSDLILFNLDCTNKLPKFARGQVYFISNDNDVNITCDVLALDYGYLVKDVPLRHIWRLNEIYRFLPPLAVKCQLVFCFPQDGTAFSKNAIEAFQDYFINGGARIIIKRKTSEKLFVQMFKSEPDDISTLLAKRGFTKLFNVAPTATNLPLLQNDWNNKFSYASRQYNVGQELHVKVLSGNVYDTFYVGRVHDLQIYKYEIENCSNFANRGELVKPLQAELMPGTPVFVKEFEVMYKRGIIREASAPFVDADVHLVDVGRSYRVPIYNLRHMVRECMYMPPISISCRAAAAQQHSVYDRYIQPGNEVMITFKELHYDCNKPHIVSISAVETTESQASRRCRSPY